MMRLFLIISAISVAIVAICIVHWSAVLYEAAQYLLGWKAVSDQRISTTKEGKH